MNNNETQQKIAIAEFCGWRSIREWTDYDGATTIQGVLGDNPDDFFTTVPDYFNDLNAMDHAESALDQYQLLAYVKRLAHTHGTDIAIIATASQRADAFIDTIGEKN